jgi:glycosyltransferase involved in cell wall biosynthesis
MRELYEDDAHPFCVARTLDEVAAQFGRLAADPAEREKVGSTGRDWVVRRHSPAAARQQYTKAFRATLADLGRL